MECVLSIQAIVNKNKRFFEFRTQRQSIKYLYVPNNNVSHNNRDQYMQIIAINRKLISKYISRRKMSYSFGKNNSRESSSKDRNSIIDISLNSLSTPKSSAIQKINEVYDEAAAHLNGLAKVLKPALELNKIWEEYRGCKSDNHFNTGQLKQSEIPYYTPQKLKCGSAISGSQGQCRCKLDQNASGKKLTADISDNRFTKKSTHQLSLQPISSTKLSKSESKPENKYIKEPLPRSSISSEDKLSGCSQKTTNNTARLESKNCSTCGININKVKVLAAAQCKHLFCYSCISRIEFNICPKCRKSIKRETIKNITNK